MGQDTNYDPQSYEERQRRRMQVVYSHKTRERQVFMQELKDYRRQRAKRIIHVIKESIGPIWYQAFSVPQRMALDTLELSIYQDLLEGRPIRTAGVIKILGIFPRPSTLDLMNCVYLGRDDPKEMLAQLFLMTYGHPLDFKQTKYCLNARLMLSGVFYLGLDNLIYLLRETFKAEPQKKEPVRKPKPKHEAPLASPYLQKMVAYLYEPPKRKPFIPLPLPDLDFNEPYEELPVITKPPPPPPPPPPPKKRLPRAYCDDIVGYQPIEPYAPVTAITMKSVIRTSHRKIGGKLSVTEVKKTYGIGSTMAKSGPRRRKPIAPKTGMANIQYLITGVFTVRGKTLYVLANVSILPVLGNLVHGGYKYMGNECINIHCGYTALPPPPKPDPCDCVKKWTDTVFKYVRTTKCYCGHHFDYGNEGTFPNDEMPFFEKANRHAPHVFNYHTIYDLEPKSLHVEKEFKRIWDADSMLHVDDGTNKDNKDKKKKKKKSSTTCLGQTPGPEDYLKCALRCLRLRNLAARLPDVHLVPELKEWMRRRMYGPFTTAQKNRMLFKSNKYWQMLLTMSMKGFGHVSPPFDPQYSGLTNWVHKQQLNDKFRKFARKYKLDMFRSQAYITNMTWPTMFQAQLPDKKFREIYFSYLFGRLEDLQIMHPYSAREAAERRLVMSRKRYCCLPDGAQDQE